MRLSFLLAVIGVTTVTGFAQPKGYDTLGPLDGDQNPAPVLHRVRSFVTQHWTHHRRGFVEFTLYTKEGAPTTRRLYIEPGEDGHWHIRGELQATESDGLPFSDPKKQPDQYVAQSFEAVSVDHDGKSLVLKDRSGKTVDEL